MKVTGDPAISTQIVRGSEPSCSVVNPWVLVTVPGTVTGIVTEHTFPFVVRVTPVIVPAVGLVVSVRLGAQASLYMRFAKFTPISSCFQEITGHLTSRIYSCTTVSTQAWKSEYTAVTPLIVDSGAAI